MQKQTHIPLFFLFLSLLLSSSCSKKPQEQQYSITLSPIEINSVVMKAQEIPVSIIPSNDSQIHLSFSDQIEERRNIDIIQNDNSLIISSRKKAPASLIILALPKNIKIVINAFNTNFSIQDISGLITIETIAGDIKARNVEGNVTIRSGRGNITISDSQGNISIFGEHGIIALDSLHGKINSTNVIGPIQFNSSLLNGDDIFLETDHGSVRATLLESDTSAIKIWTTNGTVTCLLPNVKANNTTCNRHLADPRGSFQVKTVWGSIFVDSK